MKTLDAETQAALVALRREASFADLRTKASMPLAVCLGIVVFFVGLHLVRQIEYLSRMEPPVATSQIQVLSSSSQEGADQKETDEKALLQEEYSVVRHGGKNLRRQDSLQQQQTLQARGARTSVSKDYAQVVEAVSSLQGGGVQAASSSQGAGVSKEGGGVSSSAAQGFGTAEAQEAQTFQTEGFASTDQQNLNHVQAELYGTEVLASGDQQKLNNAQFASSDQQKLNDALTALRQERETTKTLRATLLRDKDALMKEDSYAKKLRVDAEQEHRRSQELAQELEKQEQSTAAVQKVAVQLASTASNLGNSLLLQNKTNQDLRAEIARLKAHSHPAPAPAPAHAHASRHSHAHAKVAK